MNYLRQPKQAERDDLSAEGELKIQEERREREGQTDKVLLT